MDIKEKVIDIVEKQLNVAREKITQESKIVEDLGADSLDVVELTMAIEDEFGVAVSDQDAEKLISVSDVVKHIESKQ